MTTDYYSKNQSQRPKSFERYAPPPTFQVVPEAIPNDYVKEAEKVINEWNSTNLTSTKLRKIFGLFVDTYNEVKRNGGNDELNPKQLLALDTARVRMIYECGRDNDVKLFVTQAKILQYLMSVGKSIERFTAFYHYMEALVAYHRYRFGNK